MICDFFYSKMIFLVIFTAPGSLRPLRTVPSDSFISFYSSAKLYISDELSMLF